MYKTLYNIISYPLLSHNLLFTFKTVINEDCRLYLLYHHQIIKANFISFGRNPNEIHVRYLFLVEQKYEGKNREEHSCHRHFSNTKRTINAIVSLIRYNIRTMLVLTPFQSFQFFNTLGESSHDRSSIKANEELA